ncbi:MAG: DUF2779 domain-containing protein [Ureaplasma sp.]|nr:DUF2779 domain-containing protein [Ureaplasma sp.]
MKKSKYVSKYDYIAYYTKQKAMWFFTNAEVQAALKAQYSLYSINHASVSDEDEEYETDQTTESTFNNYKENKFNYDSTDWEKINNQQDSEYLNEFLKEFIKVKDADKNNPLMIEGVIIEEKAKEFIINKYNKNNQFKVFDFDKEKLNIDDLAQKTKNVILSETNAIIFQPTFIDEKRNIVTKCDFLIKEDDIITIIENKATSSCKWVHYLDLVFQKKVIENIDYLTKFNFYYELCLIAYEKLNKGDVSFITTNTINLSKTVPVDKNSMSEQEIQDKKIGIKTDKRSFEDKSIEINEILNNYFDEDKFKHSRTKAKKTAILELDVNFNKVIEELWSVKNSLNEASLPGKFYPSYNDKSEFKNTDLWLDLRKLYASEGYKLFEYSGNVVKQNGIALKDFENGIPNNFQIERYFLPSKPYENYFVYNSRDFSYLNKEETENRLSELKDKKVYFDFETINSALRVIDNTYAFTQIVTQCSIIKTIDSQNYISECNNLMIDPKDIKIEWFKQIIDDLYEGSDCSYIVYNKSFENSRLKEMKEYINDEEYSEKINIIIENVYDLADFFTLNKNYILIKELGGFYSIKKVLPLIEKYAPNIFVETKCHDYKKLNINNGALCQQKTACRFLNLVDDNEWNQIVHDSKIYCENDVRAMIAVYYFIKDFLMKNIK